MAKHFLDLNFQYGRHALSYVLVQVTVNAPLVRVKLLRAINVNPDSCSYSCLCERSLADGQSDAYKAFKGNNRSIISPNAMQTKRVYQKSDESVFFASRLA